MMNEQISKLWDKVKRDREHRDILQGMYHSYSHNAPKPCEPFKSQEIADKFLARKKEHEAHIKALKDSLLGAKSSLHNSTVELLKVLEPYEGLKIEVDGDVIWSMKGNLYLADSYGNSQHIK